jgi:hypothetical protein
MPFQYENGETSFLYHLASMLRSGVEKAGPRLRKKLPLFDAQRLEEDINFAIDAHLSTVSLDQATVIPPDLVIAYKQLVAHGKSPADHGLGFLDSYMLDTP